MAKYFNNQKKTGKVAGSVFAIRFGETIERAYNPVVANPNTAKQVEARAKLKLMSQLAAILGNDIAIPRMGVRSPRNLFVKKNYPLVTYNNNQAEVNLNAVQLTNSAVGLPSVVARRVEGTGIQVELQTLPAEINRVIYIAMRKYGNSKLAIHGTAVSNTPGTAAEAFVATLPNNSGEVVILAYGLRENTDAARAVFGDLVAPSAEQVAKLIVSRTLTDADVTLTRTSGTTLPAAQAAPPAAPNATRNVKKG